MRARLSRKRCRIPEEGDEVIHRNKRRRRRSSLSDIHCDFQILLRKLSPNDHKKIVAPKYNETVKHKNIILREPRLFLPRLDIKTFMQLRSLVANACSPDKEENRIVSKQEDKKPFDIISEKRISSRSRKPETAITNNLHSVRAAPAGISFPKAEDTVVIDPNCSNSSEEEPLVGVVKHRVLKDVRNVVSPKEISHKLQKKESNSFIPAVGRENVNCEVWSRVKRKVPLVNYCEETPIKKKPSKLVVCLRRMDPQELAEEFSETSFEAEELLDDNLRKTKKDVEIRKTRIKADVSLSQPKVPIREVHIDKVKNITLSELRKCDKKSEVTSYKRKIMRSIISSTHLEGQKNVSKSTETVNVERNSETSPKVASKSRTSRKVVEKKELSVSFKDELNVIENLQVDLDSRANKDLRRKNLHFSTPNESEPNTFPVKRIKIEGVSEPFSGFDRESRKKKKLNVSFKGGTSVIDDSSLRARKRVRQRNLITSTPGPSDGNSFSAERVENIEDPFLGFPEPIDLSSHSDFCSLVLNSFNMKPNKIKKRMTKREAAKKTEIMNLCRKTLEKANRPVKFSQRIAINRMKAELTLKAAIEAEKKECLNNSTRLLTPCVRLNRINETDLSSYRITPLREERTPLPSKTEDDYGIDDINTDDSTDDDECPKKVIPAWAKLIQENLKNSFNPQERLPRQLTRLWMKPPKLSTSIRNHLFRKRKN